MRPLHHMAARHDIAFGIYDNAGATILFALLAIRTHAWRSIEERCKLPLHHSAGKDIDHGRCRTLNSIRIGDGAIHPHP